MSGPIWFTYTSTYQYLVTHSRIVAGILILAEGFGLQQLTRP